MKSARSILHIDMDAFFAAVEILDNPEYRGKPVVIGADPKGGKGRGVVSTASYEARVFGIHSAMPISQAYRRCPHAIFLPGRPHRYGEISRQVMSILKDFSPTIQQISIDEAFLDITQTAGPMGGPLAVAKKIKQRIKDEIGLAASIGMAGNKFVAKVASDLQKPDGLTVCEPGAEKEFLAPLPIGRLWGVGKKTEEHLTKLGFRTIADIAATSQDFLAKKFGKWGSHLWQLANGIDDRPVEEWGPQKSISHEHTYEVDQDDVAVLEHTLWSLADGLSLEMRDANLKGSCLTLKIRLEGFISFTRQRGLSAYTNDAVTMRDVALELFRKFDRQGKRVRLLGIGMSRLNNESDQAEDGSTAALKNSGEQLDLFSENSPLLRQAQQSNHSEKIGELIDTLRNKYGEGSAMRGSLIERPTEPRRLGKEQLAPRGVKRNS
jgi:nucleotidyltransferase/DNA polymerase involved in DNA repair